jgi:hypothetical protein
VVRLDAVIGDLTVLVPADEWAAHNIMPREQANRLAWDVSCFPACASAPPRARSVVMV